MLWEGLVRWRPAVNLTTTAGEHNGVGTGRSTTDRYPSWAIENPRSLNLPFSDDRFSSQRALAGSSRRRVLDPNLFRPKKLKWQQNGVKGGLLDVPLRSVSKSGRIAGSELGDCQSCRTPGVFTTSNLL